VPKPLTWGEVAIVQGRRLLGCWCPEKRLRVKILCGRELLGEAKFADWGFSGEDVSDSPQRREPRPAYWDTHESPEEPTCAAEDYVELSREVGTDEDTGEEYTWTTIGPTDEVSERLDQEMREHACRVQEELTTACERLYQQALSVE
jgi:hypothetical protein